MKEQKEKKENSISIPRGLLLGGLATASAWLSSYLLKADNELSLLHFIELWPAMLLLSFVVFALGALPGVMHKQYKPENKTENLMGIIVAVLVNAAIIWYVFWR